MDKIDFRHHYLVGADTETCNTISDNGKLDMSNVLIYDLGLVACDTKGRIYEEISLVIKEIFYGMKDLMQSAYYSHKIPQYEQEIAEGKRKVVSWYEAMQILKTLQRKYKTNIMFSHNARFDYNAMNITQRYLTKSKYRYAIPYGTEYWDTLKMARDVICKEKKYIEFCMENGFVTKHKTPRPKATAEILYRYLTQDLEFEESHTGLEDVRIETLILAHCLAKGDKEMRKLLFSN